MNDKHHSAPFQENPYLKAIWLRDMQDALPEGCRVRIKDSDEPRYLGLTGVVVGHDVGGNGDWPLISVRFDHTVGSVDSDGFSDDELEVI